MNHLYLIPGLGADERIFSRLSMPLQHTHIQWISPLPKESLRNYAKRLTEQVHPDHKPIFLGISFGGMLAQEMASFYQDAPILLVSSVKSRTEMPWMMQLQRYIPLYKTIPLDKKKWEKTFGVTTKLFGVHTEDERTLLRNILSDLDISFVKWAVRAMVKWERTKPENGIIHWHGTKDYVFPTWNLKNAIHIKNGTHLMLYTDAEILSGMLFEWWKTFRPA